MISAGNDIVDLSSVDPQRSIDIRFYSKFVTTSEVDLHTTFSANLSFVSYIWLLWSVKESAYKYYQRHHPDALFSPGKVIVRLSAIPVVFLADAEFFKIAPDHDTDFFYKGTVTIDNIELCFRSIIQTNFIATVVDCETDFTRIYWGVATIQQTDQASQSSSVRALAIGELREMFQFYNFKIIKSPTGYPVVLRNSSEGDILLSLAHHNRFVSYSFKFV